jgi:putative SOS response-associated peptidase YedK
MCYHGSKTYHLDELEGYYKVVGQESIREQWVPYYHENGFDHRLSPILTNDGLGFFQWGLIPWFTKTLQDATQLRVKTLNCISEEMFDKPSYRDSLREGKRCLVPMTGFFEWKWEDLKGKEKTPYYIHLKDQKIYSAAGLYSTWKDKATDQTYHTYTILTTKANPLMEEIHNSKKRMPVILPKEFEHDWLNPDLTPEDVLAMCQPFDSGKMDAYPISKLITSRKEDSNVPKVLERVETGRLF